MRAVIVFIHYAARLRAHPAGFGTTRHLLVIPKAIAVFAALANFGAHLAGKPVEIGSSQHEIGACVEEFWAVHYHANVVGFRST
jgi:hypothetical protein